MKPFHIPGKHVFFSFRTWDCEAFTLVPIFNKRGLKVGRENILIWNSMPFKLFWPWFYLDRMIAYSFTIKDSYHFIAEKMVLTSLSSVAFINYSCYLTAREFTATNSILKLGINLCFTFWSPFSKVLLDRLPSSFNTYTHFIKVCPEGYKEVGLCRLQNTGI